MFIADCELVFFPVPGFCDLWWKPFRLPNHRLRLTCVLWAWETIVTFSVHPRCRREGLLVLNLFFPLVSYVLLSFYQLFVRAISVSVFTLTLISFCFVLVRSRNFHNRLQAFGSLVQAVQVSFG